MPKFSLVLAAAFLIIDNACIISFEYSMYLKEFEAKNELLEINERQKTDFQLTYFITLLNTAKTDLLYLTEINKNLLNEFGQEPITKQIILNSNIDFINSKKFYSNLKLLNMKGKTILELKRVKLGHILVIVILLL